MIVEKGHFHFGEKYWGGQDPSGPPAPMALLGKTTKRFNATAY